MTKLSYCYIIYKQRNSLSHGILRLFYVYRDGLARCWGFESLLLRQQKNLAHTLSVCKVFLLLAEKRGIRTTNRRASAVPPSPPRAKPVLPSVTSVIDGIFLPRCPENVPFYNAIVRTLSVLPSAASLIYVFSASLSGVLVKSR